jgi:hypothetical protein
MEMPTSCDDCSLGGSLCCHLLPGVPSVWEEYTNAVKEKRLHSDCPLVPIPPHGRLIDADKFEKENAYFWNCDFINPKYSDTLADLVNAAPTIIQADEEGDKDA